MKLSISNIAWDSSDDKNVYEIMKQYDFSALEIAPTRIVSHCPYDSITKAVKWYNEVKLKTGLVISSMQSIWYGIQEKLFGSEDDRKFLISYTKKAIDFASALNCGNLVFGCPRNRCINDKNDLEKGIIFFEEIGEYAAKKNTAIGIEANPEIYNTNYINKTYEAIELIKCIGSPGIKLNLDLGTMIENEESADLICKNIKMINHVHISEPFLNPIKPRNIHREIFEILSEENYTGFVSIEMKKMSDVSEIKKAIIYVNEVFG